MLHYDRPLKEQPEQHRQETWTSQMDHIGLSNQVEQSSKTGLSHDAERQGCVIVPPGGSGCGYRDLQVVFPGPNILRKALCQYHHVSLNAPYLRSEGVGIYENFHCRLGSQKAHAANDC